MKYGMPLCYSCSKFKRKANYSKDITPSCTKYPREIPQGIYARGKDCIYYSPKDRRKSSGKR